MDFWELSSVSQSTINGDEYGISKLSLHWIVSGKNYNERSCYRDDVIEKPRSLRKKSSHRNPSIAMGEGERRADDLCSREHLRGED